MECIVGKGGRLHSAKEDTIEDGYATTECGREAMYCGRCHDEGERESWCIDECVYSTAVGECEKCGGIGQYITKCVICHRPIEGRVRKSKLCNDPECKKKRQAQVMHQHYLGSKRKALTEAAKTRPLGEPPKWWVSISGGSGLTEWGEPGIPHIEARGLDRTWRAGSA